ncbi:MAG: hemerythrin domain-containing protein [Muribaculaceae bacterium]|nr:hemerythrin domain-containing protein [Muribaculaceae bacterium]MDE6321523.1 hemerythrin domain-containing protein [Muribaculaceae bacterium]
MNHYIRFSPSDSMVDLVNYDFNIIPLLSRFSLPLGYKQNTIGDVCQQAGIDVNAFLLIIHYVLGGVNDENLRKNVKASDIVKFLANSHEYFLSYKFPHIRQNLLLALDDNQSMINPSIIEFFDEFVAKVKRHFRYEERHLFPYIIALEKGEPTTYDIDTFVKQHDDVSTPLSELKNIILRYYATSVPNKMYDVLVDIYNCEADIQSHADIEDDILVPIVTSMIS